MAWFNLFSGPTAERLEQKGDALGAAGLWGAAKLEYERAHRKRETAADQDRDNLRRLAEKIAGTREALAREHHRNAADLAVFGVFKEAFELVALSLVFFFFKQQTAYEISECDWSSDVCYSDLAETWRRDRLVTLIKRLRRGAERLG